MMKTFKTLETRYEHLSRARQNKLERAYQCAEISIPSLLPRSGRSQSVSLPIPNQAMVARGVVRLAARLTSANLPANDIPYFTFYINDFVDDPDISVVEQALESRERRIRRRLAGSNLRSKIFQAYKFLIVVGECLIQEIDSISFKIHRLDRYVVRRTPEGTPFEIILQEWVDVEALEPSIQSKVASGTKSPNIHDEDAEPLYTQLLWSPKDKVWKVKRELRGIDIDDAPPEYEILPYWIFTWNLEDGEDYSTSLCEENFGDLLTLDSLTSSLIDVAAMVAEHRTFVDPTGLTEVQDLVESENGDYVPGRAQDLFLLNLGSVQGLQVTAEAVNMWKRDIAQTFLLGSSSRRDAERVTAAEVQLDAVELDQALGGVLSLQNRQLIPPIVERTASLMVRQKLLEDLDIGTKDNSLIKIKVRSGLDTISREVDLQRLKQMGIDFVQIPELRSQINWNEFSKRYVTNIGLNHVGLVFTQEELAQQQQAQQQQQLLDQVQQQGIQSAGNITEAQGQAQAQAQAQAQQQAAPQ